MLKWAWSEKSLWIKGLALNGDLEDGGDGRGMKSFNHERCSSASMLGGRGSFYYHGKD